MRTAIIRWVATVSVALLLFLTFRVFVPAMVNMQNDGALIIAIVLAIAIPPIAFVGLYKVWTETFE